MAVRVPPPRPVEAPPPNPTTVLGLAGTALLGSLVCDWFGVRALKRLPKVLKSDGPESPNNPAQAQSASDAVIAIVFFHGLQLLALFAWVICLIMGWRLKQAGHPSASGVIAAVVAAPIVSLACWMALQVLL